MLRIWDCFLLEGPKVLFRFALALLGVHESSVMERFDTISIIKLLKASARLTYDVDGLIKLAFENFKPFPRRSELQTKQRGYLKMLKERLKQKQQLRNALALSPAPIEVNFDQLPIEVLVFNNDEFEYGFIASGHQKLGKLAVIQLNRSQVRFVKTDISLDCRIVSMVICPQQMIFVSLLSGFLVAFELSNDGEKCHCRWEIKLSDVALRLVHSDGRLYAALANGTLTVLDNPFVCAPITLELYHIPIGPAPISDAIIVKDQLWLAAGCKVVIVNKRTLDHIDHIYVATSAAGSGALLFEKIRRLHVSDVHGVWLVTANSSVIQLWDSNTYNCRLLFDITTDHCNRKTTADNCDDSADVHIVALFCYENSLWVGTADGYLMMYDIVIARYLDSFNSSLRYPPGQRISPNNCVNNRQLYYIPTKDDAGDNQYQHNDRHSIIDKDVHHHQLSSSIDRHLHQSANVITGISTIIGGVSIKLNGHDSGYSQTSSADSTDCIARRYSSTDTENSVIVKPTDSTPIVQSHRPANRSLSTNSGGVSWRLANRRRLQHQQGNIRQLIRSLSHDAPGACEIKTKPISIDSGTNGELLKSTNVVGDKWKELRMNRSRNYGYCSSSTSSGRLHSDSSSIGVDKLNKKVHNHKYVTRMMSADCVMSIKKHQLKQQSTINSSTINDNDAQIKLSPIRNVKSLSNLMMASNNKQLSSTTCSTVAVDGYEYDDLFDVYSDDLTGRQLSVAATFESTGLASEQLGTSESMWSLHGADESITNGVGNNSDDQSRNEIEQEMLENLNSANCKVSPNFYRYQQRRHSSESVRLRRKDLQFDDVQLQGLNLFTHRSTSAKSDPGPMIMDVVPSNLINVCVAFPSTNCNQQLNNNIHKSDSNDIRINTVTTSNNNIVEHLETYQLDLQMKLKISDKPVKCIGIGRHNLKDVLITCAGNYGDDESILQWTKEDKTGLWTNEPIIIDPIDRDNTPSINSKYTKSFTFSSFANSIGRKMS